MSSHFLNQTTALANQQKVQSLQQLGGGLKGGKLANIQNFLQGGKNKVGPVPVSISKNRSAVIKQSIVSNFARQHAGFYRTKANINLANAAKRSGNAQNLRKSHLNSVQNLTNITKKP